MTRRGRDAVIPTLSRRRRLVAVVLLVLFAGCDGAERPGSPAVERRVVLITLDTLRRDSFAGAEGRASTLPNTSRWAKGAVVFENFFAASPQTQPSHASMLTGLHPWQHGVTYNGVVLDPKLLTVAEKMRAAGYRTGAVVASFPLHHHFGFDQGFDRYHDVFTRGGPSHRWGGAGIDAKGGFFTTCDDVLEHALEMLDSLGGRRQFFWFHFFDPHSPYGDHDGGAGPGLRPSTLAREIRAGADPDEVIAIGRAAYDRDVRAMDAALGSLFERLDRDGVETHVVVVSDHGESFGEDGSLGHGKRLTRAEIQVPLIVRSPRLAPGVRDQTAAGIDVANTLLGLAGLAADLPGGRDLTTVDPAEESMAFGMRRADAFVEWRLAGRRRRVSDEDHRFFAVERGRLYTGDPGSVSLDDGSDSLENPEEERRYRAMFEGFDRAWGERHGLERTDPRTREALEALGYAE